MHCGLSSMKFVHRPRTLAALAPAILSALGSSGWSLPLRAQPDDKGIRDRPTAMPGVSRALAGDQHRRFDNQRCAGYFQ